MHRQGKVVRWETDRGFGFIRSPGTTADVFFHVRDFRGPGVPIEGLVVSYEEIHVGGKGPRAMAVRGEGGGQRASANHRGGPPRPRLASPANPGTVDPFLPWVLLLAAICVGGVVWAVLQRQLPLSVLLFGLVVNAMTFWFYWRDKYAARQRAWRTPESTLHCLSLLGGWPAARAAQQLLRHKSAKASFQQVYWLTVLLNLAALVAMVWPGARWMSLPF